MPKYYIKSNQIQFVIHREEPLMAAMDTLKYYLEKNPEVDVDGQVFATEYGFFNDNKKRDNLEDVYIFDIKDLFTEIENEKKQ